MKRPLRLLPPDSGMGWTPYAWLIYLLTFFVGPVAVTRAGHAPWWLWPATIAATLVFLVTYFVGHWVRGRGRLAVAVIHTGLGVLFAPFNPGACVFFVYGASFMGMLDRSRVALRGLLAVVAVGAVTALTVDAPLYFGIVAVVIALLVGGVNLHYTQRARAESKLRLAHQEIEQLAAIAERERIARDLHDVLGHTLSLIVLKAELAVKLAEVDPERAAREMRDVEDVARRTLQDVRLAIRGYRTTLPEELDRAASMLKAARVRADIDAAETRLPPAVDETLALVLREAVTNVVRHADASRCTIRLSCTDDTATLAVRDDGRGIAASPGLGLRGMRERIEFMNGTMSIDGSRGTSLTVSLPIGDPAPADGTRPAPESRETPAPARRPGHPTTPFAAPGS